MLIFHVNETRKGVKGWHGCAESFQMSRICIYYMHGQKFTWLWTRLYGHLIMEPCHILYNVLHWSVLIWRIQNRDKISQMYSEIHHWLIIRKRQVDFILSVWILWIFIMRWIDKWTGFLSSWVPEVIHLFLTRFCSYTPLQPLMHLFAINYLV